MITGNDLSNEVKALESGDFGGGPKHNPSMYDNLSSDPAQLIYELLQNADDASADKVIFRLTEDRLDVHHNGDDFEYGDIRGVVDFGYSNKSQGKIGRFGIGFKSVYRVTSTPHIFSGKYNVKIVNQWPKAATPNDDKELKTLIRLPFNRPDRTKEEAIQTVKQKLESMGTRVLLFLKNVKKIEWTTLSSEGESSGGEYSKTSSTKKLRSKKYPNISAISNVKLKSPKGTHEYIVLKKPFEDTTFFVEAAFRLEKNKNGKEKIVAEKDTRLAVFFSTTEITDLNFVLHGPYDTNLSRETVNFKYRLNERIVNETGKLVADCLPAIKSRKDLKHLYVDFLSLLPTDSRKKKEGGGESMYSKIYDRIVEKLRSEKLLPTSKGGYTYSADSLMSSDVVRKLLNKANMDRLYPKKSWIETRVTNELQGYLKNVIGVNYISFSEFVRDMREYGIKKFMWEQTDKWMVAFYTELLEYELLWDQDENDPFLRYEPIIRFKMKEQIAPFVLLDGREKAQIYLPTKDQSAYDTVKSSLVKDKGSRKFLKRLGLTPPNIVARVIELILPKYEGEINTPDDKYFDDFRDILKAYEKIPLDERRRLKNARFILATENVTGKVVLRAPSDVYFRTEKLEVFFEGYERAYFVSQKLLRGDRRREFLEKLGVGYKPRRIKVEGDLSCEERKLLRYTSRDPWGDRLEDYEYEGLENFLTCEINTEKSHLLWEMLLKSIGTFYAPDLIREFFMGKYDWWFHSGKEYSAEFPSSFLKTLQQNEWLTDKSGDFKKPCDLTFSELSDSYEKENWHSRILVDILEFKQDTQVLPDLIQELPDDERRMLELARENKITPEKFEQLITEDKKTQADEDLEDETDEDIPDTRIRTIEEPVLNPRPAPVPVPRPIPSPGPKPNPSPKKTIVANKKRIGKKGERRVLRTLKECRNVEEFEVVWPNENGECEGYDIHIVKKQDGGIEEIVEYIEVKSKTGEKPEEVVMTGAQWRLAREQGDKYYLYVVSNVRSDEYAKLAIYRNPYRLWEEGKLPVEVLRIKL